MASSGSPDEGVLLLKGTDAKEHMLSQHSPTGRSFIKCQLDEMLTFLSQPVPQQVVSSSAKWTVTGC
jgi:hypothetical protein